MLLWYTPYVPNQTKTGGKTIEEVFKLRQNVIWDDGRHYILEHVPSGVKGIFDRSDKALSAVKRAIENDSSFTPFTKNNYLYVQPNKSSSYCLSQLLYGTYHNKSMAWIKKGHVRFVNRDYTDYTSDNLYHTQVDTADNTNRRIWRMGDYIFLLHKKSGQCFFCNYNPELFRLLCNHRITWGYQSDIGRLKSKVMRAKRPIKDLIFGFHSLVYAFYYYGARYRNFIGAVRRMQNDFDKKKLVVDHLDDNQTNNMIWNLSPMTKNQNSIKADRLGRIRHPFFLFAAYHNGKYKLLCGRVYETEAGLLDPTFDAAFILCKDADSLNDFLKVFQDAKWEDGLSPAENMKKCPDAVCFQDYFGDFGATQIRKLLMEREEQDFAVWEGKGKDDD